MAKKSRSKSATAKTTDPVGQDKTIITKIVLDMSEGLPNYYVNHAEISHSPHEFNILFAKIPTRANAGK